MRLGVLGPLLVVDDAGCEVPLAAAHQRTLFAVLLVRANRAVPVDELVEVVWDGAPPRTAARTLRSYVARLRRTVGPQVAARIETRDPGYLCRLDEHELDTLRFEALCRQAGAALRAGRWAEAAEAGDGALQLWRGAPLLDVPSQALRDEIAPRLEQLRLQALEDRAEADLHLDNLDPLVPRLRELAGAYPLRERFHSQLMLALARGGRQAEALKAYQNARRVLVEQLGIEPGAELRELHQRILAGDAELLTPPRPVSEPRVPSAAAAPRQLPAAIGHFVGRAAELAALAALPAGAGGTGGAVVVSSIGGTAGIGKSALAVHFAHQVADRFPDGQLFVDLRGFDPSGSPLQTAVAVRRILDALAVPAERIPADPQAQLDLYRSVLADKRVLIVLDNARDSGQVRALLPGSAGCLVLVTSRSRLTDLVALDGAIPLTLDLLTEDEARALLTRRLGAERTTREPQAVDELIDLCARLPLALNIAAARAALHPSHRLSKFADELRDAGRRLDALAGGEGAADVRAVFSWSYRTLGPEAARAFRLLALHPGTDLDRYAAASLLGTDVPQAEQTLNLLAGAHLVQHTGTDRYSMHDLLRAYAREQALDEESEKDRHIALTGLHDHYLHTAAAAMDTLYPAEAPRRPRIRPDGSLAAPLAGVEAARGWLDAECTNLVRVVAHADDHGWPGHAVGLAATLFRYLEATCRYPHAAMIHDHALQAADKSGDRAAQATALTNLGVAELRLGRQSAAREHLEQARDLCRVIGDRVSEARTEHNLSLIDWHQARYPDAAEHLRRALDLCQASGDRLGVARSTSGLGEVEQRLGRYPQAARHLRQAAALSAALGDQQGQAEALLHLGTVESRQDHCAEADDHMRQALGVFRALGDRRGEAETLANLGAGAFRQGRHPQALDHLAQALALCEEIGDEVQQAQVLNTLGEVLLAAGRPDQALARHAAALALAERTDNRDEQTRAHQGLVDARTARGDTTAAHAARQHAPSTDSTP